ncbi:uncharacterized protein Tco025E_05346 [Trypanosoma conorhini]|uniref:Ubiquitin-like domain-containing protein n=1 Tax=Trypanosoma conorhini TaxID=83891 RepID=A0A3R7PBC4_9TRYP|nr:uncharacterized protein Tco025E_05346 [Trypanosoma conorhini]RNF15910.1 hypothetical protein Tco025E_05346 [Trypanosoma conorhini]
MMFRRLCLSGGVRAIDVRFLSMTSDARDALTKQLSALKEECKGQGLDLADMSDASRAAMRAVQDGLKRANVEDDQFKGKCTTLSASMKAYTARLSNLQDEARSIQAEADALLKLMWGTEAPPKDASFASPPKSAEEAGSASAAAAEVKGAETEDDEFIVEPPPLAKALGNDKRPPERVEAERVQDTARKSAEEVVVEEIEVETIEVEVEPNESPADTMKITDITKDLYERGVNFSDCLDARTLRQRYRDVLAGKLSPGIHPGTPTSTPQAAEANTNQPRMPEHRPYQQQPQQYYQQQQQQQANTSESGLAHDPYPNAYRKMVDPMKHVWELKNELAAEKGIDPKSVDLWSGKCKLEDHKVLYDYPSVQSYPIEVRQKGDIPR